MQVQSGGGSEVRWKLQRWSGIRQSLPVVQVTAAGVTPKQASG